MDSAGSSRRASRRRRRLSFETAACAWSGHVAPALLVRELDPARDADLGFDREGRRFARCLRCDAWVSGAPGGALGSKLADLEPLPLPSTGEALRGVFVTRLIALDRLLHMLLLVCLALALALMASRTAAIDSWASELLATLDGIVQESRRGGAYQLATRGLGWLTGLTKSSVDHGLVGALALAVLEAVEAAGLWLGKRWVEVLTVLEVSALVPFEVDGLVHHPTALRLALLALNVAVVVYLVWAKRLFGLGRPLVPPSLEERGLGAHHFLPDPATCETR